ncbi:GNAT family N-acetyltransferase [Adhaeribacter aquaticus]|uniref:GNAT family N-acetyltransferase n=1 Tax=Adhaeribacter aquaticus TaxID=299567 RepID=UPI00040E87BA|nr:GNAT family N-acetyltransferase [Adhaeribacter aquaticus]
MDLEIIDNKINHHFETTVEGKTAFIDYKKRPSALVIFHTEVPKELEGRGIAAALTKHVLDYAAREELGVVPFCPYMLAYLKRHPEYHYLVKSKKAV